MADQVRHDVHGKASLKIALMKKKNRSRNIETGFSLSYEGLEPSTHALKGRCSTN